MKTYEIEQKTYEMIIKNCNGGRFTYKSDHFVVESGQIEHRNRTNRTSMGEGKGFQKNQAK